jgi:hypothetical protein
MTPVGYGSDSKRCEGRLGHRSTGRGRGRDFGGRGQRDHQGGVPCDAPSTYPDIGSAFVAGLVGGLLYAGLTRFLDYPVGALWILVLLLATVDSILVAVLPAAAGRTPPFLFPLAGLLFPIRQLTALIGLGQFGTGRFPAQFLFANTVIHYVTAASVAFAVPPVVRLLRRF